MANPYEPPSATDTSSHSLESSWLAWAAFFAVCALVAWLTRGMPYVTVIVIAAFGAILLPFVGAAVRRRRIWGFVSGLVLAIILPAMFLRLTMEPPNTYATVAAYNEKLDLILAFTIPLGV